ncbi:MAG: lytic murein transglycosylase [Mesorhizobium sp.]|nr:MAG: lytic murein transglycosylase [Mesorhizobium sp.]RWM29026.1 MAG: lytic murein transglycosylase [Mesorhizobium sp.]RWM38579.1 MAG: lytic murein transglycosylase [Mesorhizobium sp.]TIO53417.1 MAG: lytic murein transglycosylase [Mesorhizobium sp.]TIO59866.1 MAG: lytic murein transglycosylase [Mesorhizobium sp.]
MFAPGTPLWPAGHLPLKGGDQPSLRPSQITSIAEWAVSPKLPISPLEGEMSGRTEGGALALPHQANGASQ